jgi:ABC-type multidrug transport system ATPase subunit
MVDKSSGGTSDFILSMANVAKSFSRHQVLRDVTFDLRPGEIVGIVGENGSGKSTLLKIIVGLLSPNAGHVSARGRIGYCPQDMLVFETLTVAENFSYFATAYGLTGNSGTGSWRDTRRQLLQRMRFSPHEHRLVSTLSGGTRQKLNFCLAVLHSPELLILDEPYAGFDWETYLHFWDYAEELKAAGKGILIVSHFIYDRQKFDAVFELAEGVLRCV